MKNSALILTVGIFFVNLHYFLFKFIVQLPFLLSQNPDYYLQCHPDCNVLYYNLYLIQTCFGVESYQCIRCANQNLKIQNGRCVENCQYDFNYILQKCNNYVSMTLNVLNNPVLFEVVLDQKVFGENFEMLSLNFVEILIDELTVNSNFTYTLKPNLITKTKYSFFILMKYKPSVRILDHIFMTIHLSLPSDYIKQGHILTSESLTFQLHKYQNICDSDQFYNYKTWDCEQRVNIISRLFVTEDRNVLQLALNELDFQYLIMIEDYTQVIIQEMNTSNYGYSIRGNFFQIKKGKLNLQEEFDHAMDNFNDFYIIINYTNKIIYQKPLITLDFSQFPDYLQTNSRFLLKQNVSQSELIDNFQLSDANKDLIDGVSDTMAIINNIVEFLAIICILGYPQSVFVFVLLLQLKYPLMLKFMNIDYPPNISNFYQNQYAFETKWIYFYKFSKNILRDLKLISDNFEIFETSPYFLDNIGDKIIRILIIMLICGILYLVNKHMGKVQTQKQSLCKTILQKFVQAYMIAIPLSFILSYFFEISFYIWCSFQFAAIYSIKGIVNIAISVVCFFILNWFLLGLYKVQVRQIQTYRKLSMRTNVKKCSTMILDDQTEIFSPEYPKSKVFPESYLESEQHLSSDESNKYYIFQHDFANNKDFFTEYFIFLLALKYFVLSFILALFHKFLAFQIVVQCFIIITFGILAIKYKPYQSNIFNALYLAIDILVLLYQVLLIILIILDKIENPTEQHVSARMTLGWILIALYFLQLLIVLGIFLYFSTKLVIFLVKEIREKNLLKQITVQNQTSSQITPTNSIKNTTSDKKFSPLSFQVHNVNHENNSNLLANLENHDQNSSIAFSNQQTIPSQIKTKNPASLQLNYLTDKLKKSKTNAQQQDIELEQSFQLQEIEENTEKQSVYPFDANEQQQNRSILSPQIQSRSHFDSPLLKKTNAEFLGENKSPKW